MVPPLCRSLRGARRSWRPPSRRAHLPPHTRARAHAGVALLGTWFSLANHRKVSFTAVQRRLAEDQIAAPLKANSRLSEGVNISQRVTSVLFIMNIFSLLSGDLPTPRSHKTSPRPHEGRLRLSSPPPPPRCHAGGDPAGFHPAPAALRDRRMFFGSPGSPPALLQAGDT